MDISAYYDPMLAKIIAHGETREEARRKLVTALENTAIFGPTTNKAFLIAALEKPDFANGAATTGFIDQNFSEKDLTAPAFTIEIAALASMLLFIKERAAAYSQSIGVPQALLNWHSASKITTPYLLQVGETQHAIDITPQGASNYAATAGDETLSVTIDRLSDHDATMTVNGNRKTILFHIPDNSRGRVQISLNGTDFDIQNLHAVFASQDAHADAGTIIAPMHGLLLEVQVEIGQKIAAGDRLAVLEAMKMQHEMTANAAGTVTAIHHAAGDQVSANSVLIEIDPDDA